MVLWLRVLKVVVASASRMAFVGDAGSLARRAVSLSRAKSATTSFSSLVLSSRTAFASSVSAPYESVLEPVSAAHCILW